MRRKRGGKKSKERWLGKSKEEEIEKSKEEEEEMKKKEMKEEERRRIYGRKGFVVRTTNSEMEPKQIKDGTYVDFHYVDLATREVSPKYLPSLYNAVEDGHLVTTDGRHQFYIFGGIFTPEELESQSEVLSSSPDYYHLGASELNLLSTTSNWQFSACPTDRQTPNLAALSGKIYSFGIAHLCPQVFTPGGTPIWHSLPNLDGHRMCSPVVLPDPLNDRILVHLCDTRDLYAFYPKNDPHNMWVLLAPRFPHWFRAAAVVDNILYFHDSNFTQLVIAYDLSTREFLQVVADVSKVEITVREFDAIFNLDSNKGFICLVSKLSCLRESPSIHFLTFKVDRTSLSQLTLTALDYQSHYIPSASRISDFLLIGLKNCPRRVGEMSGKGKNKDKGKAVEAGCDRWTKIRAIFGNMVREGSPCTSDSEPGKNDDPIVGQDPCQSVGGLERDVMDTVVVHTHYVKYGEKYFPALPIHFSTDSVAIDGVSEWKLDDILQVEYLEYPQPSLADLTLVKIQMLPNHSSEIANETAGVIVVEFLVPYWSHYQEQIMSLHVRYNAVFSIGLDMRRQRSCNGDPLEDTECFSHLFRLNFEEVVYPEGEIDAVLLRKSDVNLLLPEVFINDKIVDFYIRYLKNGIPMHQRPKFHFFDTHFFQKLANLGKNPSNLPDGKAAFQRVKQWTRKVNIFEKDYLFIPVNYELHWSLIIICHPGEVDGNNENAVKVPCILHMDSVRGFHVGMEALFQSYILEEWKERHKETPVDVSKLLNLKFISLEVPQQENRFDCGLFLLHYAERFIDEAPKNFSPFLIGKLGNFLKPGWFMPADASCKRVHIQRLIYELLKSMSHKSASPANEDIDDDEENPAGPFHVPHRSSCGVVDDDLISPDVEFRLPWGTESNPMLVDSDNEDSSLCHYPILPVSVRPRTRAQKARANILCQ